MSANIASGSSEDANVPRTSENDEVMQSAVGYGKIVAKPAVYEEVLPNSNVYDEILPFNVDLEEATLPNVTQAANPKGGVEAVLHEVFFPQDQLPDIPEWPPREEGAAPWVLYCTHLAYALATGLLLGGCVCLVVLLARNLFW